MTNKQEFIEFRTGYMDSAWEQQGQTVRIAREVLREVNYDTMVGIGMSGAVMIPVLAYSLRKKFMIIRKKADYESCHAGLSRFGYLGSRWLFVDDFIQTGNTFAAVRKGVDQAIISLSYLPLGSACETRLVGSYQYNSGTFNPY